MGCVSLFCTDNGSLTVKKLSMQVSLNLTLALKLNLCTKCFWNKHNQTSISEETIFNFLLLQRIFFFHNFFWTILIFYKVFSFLFIAQLVWENLHVCSGHNTKPSRITSWLNKHLQINLNQNMLAGFVVTKEANTFRIELSLNYTFAHQYP